MSNIQEYSVEREKEFQQLAESAENLVIADDNGCQDAIDLHGSCADTMAQIDSMLLLQNKPTQDIIDANNKAAQALKDCLIRAEKGFHLAIGVHLSDTGAQRIKSGTATAYFRENKDKIEVEIVDAAKIPDKFLTKKPNLTAIKKEYRDNGKTVKGTLITSETQEPTLAFREVK